MTDPVARLNAALSGRYRIERQLGEGGMATVYLADDLKHERKVALKVLKPELAAVVGTERFLAEIKTTANLQHPHILPLHDSAEADGFLFYVMPYIEGESLRERIDREHQLPVDEAVRIASDVAEALHAAHEQGVIHRDIKPANILLSRGRPLIADFGIALAVSAAGSGRLTETGLSLGTPHYMSPEQATGDQHVGPATDIYALGCVLYEMLVGEPPYTGSTPQAVLGKIITGTPEPVTQHRKTVPLNVEATVNKALERVPADRFASAQEFVRALGDFSFGLGDGAVEGKARQRNSTLMLGWVVVASALGGALLAGLLRRNPEGGPVTRLSVGVPTGHLMPVGQNKSLAISHDGRTVAYVTDGLLRVRSLGDSEAMQVPGTGYAYSLFFSPDDTWIGFSDGDGTRKVEIASGAVVNIEGAAPADYGSAWGPDDQIVLSPSLGQSGLWRVPAEGGGMQQVTTVSDVDLETAHVWPQVLPDGRGILFTVLGPSGGWDDGRIAVLEAGEAQHTVVLERATSAHYAPSGHLIYALASGTIMAQPFDLDALQADGPAVPVLDGVRVGTFGGGASLAVSDGGTIAYVSGTTETEHILLARSRRGGLRQLGEPLQGAWLDVSPDGQHLALTRRTPNNDDIVLIDAASGTRERFTSQPDEDETPVWSPDGGTIAYSAAWTGQARRIYRRPVDGSTEAQQLASVRGHIHLEDWSPDNQWFVASQSDPQTDLDLWLLRADGAGEPERVVGEPSNQHKARISPNGEWVVYTSDETGQSELGAAPFPAFAPRRQLTTDGGDDPRWAHETGDFFFMRGEILFVAEAAFDGTLRLSTPRELFELPDYYFYDVAPDGESVYFLALNTGSLAREIHIILNWFEELRARVPN